MGLLLLLAVIVIPSSPAKAQQSVVINPPTSLGPNSTYRMRTMSGRGTRPHRGHDYPTPCGTTINTQAPVTCGMAGGYGSLAEASHGCGVVTRYAHLNSCTAGQSSVVTGGARGTPGAGNSTGCHLHYEVRIDGTAINPASAFGQNLCDPAVRQRLIQEAQQIMQGQAGGGGGMTQGQTPNSGTPTSGTGTGTNNVQSIVYVPGGTFTNPGAGYYQVTYVDGRVVREVDLRGEGIEQTQLPPTTEDVVPSTNSTSNPVTGCATDTWSAMVNLAVLQTRREMAINQRYVAKGDSVMAYSCLSEQLRLVGEHHGILSESQMWANREVDILNGHTVTVTVDMGRYSLDGAITNVATEPYEGYLETLFNYDFLGGMAEGLAGEGDEHGHGESQAHAPCGVMRQVWDVAKCMNMTDDPLFPRFEDMISTDPRQYPDNYRCNDTGITQNMINRARGEEVDFDDVETYLDMLYPTGSCHTPLATGITVQRQEGADRITTTRTYPDGLCITAGCSYQNTGSGNGRCEIRQP